MSSRPETAPVILALAQRYMRVHALAFADVPTCACPSRGFFHAGDDPGARRQQHRLGLRVGQRSARTCSGALDRRGCADGSAAPTRNQVVFQFRSINLGGAELSHTCGANHSGYTHERFCVDAAQGTLPRYSFGGALHALAETSAATRRRQTSEPAGGSWPQIWHSAVRTSPQVENRSRDWSCSFDEHGGC